MKKTYLFALGRDPELSRIELDAYFEVKGIKAEIKEENENIAVVVTNEELPKETINELGGTIKIAEVISTSNEYYDIEKSITDYGLYKGTENKITYYIEHYQTQLFTLVSDFLKEYFKEQGIKAAYKKDIEPSRLFNKDLSNDVINIIIFQNLIGVVTYVSNPKELKKRDLGRPDVDYLKTISIRLAKIMVNISRVKKGGTLIDPFCGSGTVLQEALLKGVNVIGFDSDAGSIKQSRANLEWLKKNYGTLHSNYELFLLDARKMTSVIKKANGIVTEPYLGPFIRKLPRIDEAKQTMSELSELYSIVVKQGKEMLNKDERIVMIIPIIRTLEAKDIKMDFTSIASMHGFTVVYKPVFYAHKGSKLHREIYVLEKN